MKPSILKFLLAGLIAVTASAAQAQDGNVTVQYTLTDQNGATRPRAYIVFSYGLTPGAGTQVVQRAGTGYGEIELPAMQDVTIKVKDDGCSP